jgi:hypothetical protein
MAVEGKSYRWNMRVQPDWMEQVRFEAGRLGLTPTDYVTMAVKERLERDRATRPEPSARVKSKKGS